MTVFVPPICTGAVSTFDHGVIVTKLALACNAQLVNKADQRIFTWSGATNAMDRTGSGSTKPGNVTLLFAGLGSTLALPALAVTLMLPTELGVKTSVTLAVALLASAPRLAVMMFALVASEPCVVLAEIRADPTGKVLVSITAGAASGPRFFTVMTEVTLLPTVTGLGELVTITSKSLLGGRTIKWETVVALPAGVQITREPVVASPGTVAVIWLLLLTVNAALTLLNRTEVAPVKFVP